jgi:hypothetical protein
LWVSARPEENAKNLPQVWISRSFGYPLIH